MNFQMKSSETVLDSQITEKYVLTSGKSPEEVLSLLGKYGIEWHVTEEGTLMIKYWQVGAEDFVPIEHAAIIRASSPSPEQSDKLDWLSKNMQNIRSEYGGQWVAVYDDRIVASAQLLPELMNQILEYDRPLITFIPAEPVVWTFTYAV